MFTASPSPPNGHYGDGAVRRLQFDLREGMLMWAFALPAFVRANAERYCPDLKLGEPELGKLARLAGQYVLESSRISFFNRWDLKRQGLTDGIDV